MTVKLTRAPVAPSGPFGPGSPSLPWKTSRDQESWGEIGSYQKFRLQYTELEAWQIRLRVLHSHQHHHLRQLRNHLGLQFLQGVRCHHELLQDLCLLSHPTVYSRRVSPARCNVTVILLWWGMTMSKFYDDVIIDAMIMLLFYSSEEWCNSSHYSITRIDAMIMLLFYSSEEWCNESHYSIIRIDAMIMSLFYSCKEWCNCLSEQCCYSKEYW